MGWSRVYVYHNAAEKEQKVSECFLLQARNSDNYVLITELRKYNEKQNWKNWQLNEKHFLGYVACECYQW